MMKKILTKYKYLFIYLAIIVLSGFSHGINMFNFPYYENDEGTYMSQAWSILRRGELAPYTYWYDHAPAGWMLIAAWVKLTGGFFTFGTSVNSGRVLMLVLHIATSMLLYYIAKRLSGRSLPGILAVIIYSLSPLGIYFQRRVLLDNIMTFWLFASIALLLKKNLNLSHIIISSITLGIAVLTKESAIFFVPAFLYLIIAKANKNHRVVAVWLFIICTFSVVSTYFLYAFLKKELFPTGFFGDTTEHVSLLDTVKYNLGRGSSLPFWHRRSDFTAVLSEWLNKDAKIVFIGGLASILGLILSIRVRYLRVPTILSLLFIFFLVRGGIVLGFYIVPLIPIFALLVGILSNFIVEKLSLNHKQYLVYSFVFILFFAIYFFGGNYDHFVRNETRSQIDTIKYIKEEIPEDAFLVMDDSIYVDLHEPGFINDKVFKNAEWSWKVEKDPEVREEKLGNDFRKIDYIILSHEILKQMKFYKEDFVERAFLNSSMLIDFSEGTTSYMDLPQLISTNGDWMKVYKTKDNNDIYLAESFKHFKGKFIHNYGQVVDPSSGNTTSEGQSYAMLRALWVDDRETFDGTWKWTKDHMQFRGTDMLLSWLWGKDESGESIKDPNASTDADEDIALALIFASRKWNEPKYMLEAMSILRDIWDKEVIEVGGRLLLLSSPNSEREDGYLVNPSYFSPAAYRIFAKADTTNDWERLADDSYLFLDDTVSAFGSNKLVPNWVLAAKDGEISSASKYVNGEPDYYGYDAFRTYFRVALDAKWFPDSQAKNFLKGVEPFFVDQWKNRSKFNSVYAMDGTMITSYETPATSVAPLSIFAVSSSELAKTVFAGKFEKYIVDSNWKGNDQNYYDHNWTWFGIALYTGKLVNYWK